MKRYYAEATLPSTMPALKRTKSSETNVTTRPMPLLPPDPSHPSPPSQLDLEQTKTPTLLELLTLKQPRPRHPVAAPAAPAPASKTIRSVLHNLLVSGYDSKAGYTILEQVAASKDDDLLCPPTRTPPSPASPSVDPYLVNPSPPPSASDNVLTLSGLDVALLGKVLLTSPSLLAYILTWHGSTVLGSSFPPSRACSSSFSQYHFHYKPKSIPIIPLFRFNYQFSSYSVLFFSLIIF